MYVTGAVNFPGVIELEEGSNDFKSELKIDPESKINDILQVKDNDVKDKIFTMLPFYVIGNSAKEGTFTTGKKIKEILQTIYDKAGFDKKATISDFRNYAELKPTSKRIDGEVVKGYIITLIKTKYIRKKK